MAVQPLGGAGPQIVTLDNGLRVVCEPMSSTRAVAVSMFVAAGARYEADQLAGVSHFVEHCVFKGSELFPTAAEIATAVEGVGGYINAATDRESTVYYAKAPGTDWQTALDVIVDMVTRPRFQRDEVEKERQVILEELAQVEDSPYQLVSELMSEVMWRGTPLGRDVAGTPQSVQRIPYADTVAYWQGQYAPSQSVLSVAGDIDPDEVVSRVMELTDAWSASVEPTERRAAPIASAGSRVSVRAKETEQTQISIGLPIMSSEHPDRYAMSLLSAMLGDGMSSRLFLKVREELGLVYDIQAGMSQLSDSGTLVIGMGVDPENVDAALSAALGELARMRDGVSEDELVRTQRLAAGRLLIELEDTRSVAVWNGGQLLMRGRIHSVDEMNERFAAVSTDDIARLAQEYLREDELRLAAVGPNLAAERFEPLLRF